MSKTGENKNGEGASGGAGGNAVTEQGEGMEWIELLPSEEDRKQARETIKALVEAAEKKQAMPAPEKFSFASPGGVSGSGGFNFKMPIGTGDQTIQQNLFSPRAATIPRLDNFFRETPGNNPVPEAVWTFLATNIKYDGVPEWRIFRGQFMYQLNMLGSLSEENRKSVLLMSLSPALYARVKNWLNKAEVDMSLDELDTALTALCDVPFSTWMEIRKFRSAKMQEGEEVTGYFHRLKEISVKCEFSDAEQQIRDQLIVGMPDKIFDKVMTMPRSMTLAEALVKCQSEEFRQRCRSVQVSAANVVKGRNVRDRLGEMPAKRPKEKSEGQEKSGKDNAKDGTKTNRCFRCLSHYHEAKDCPYHNAECFGCKKKGHIARACNKKNANVKKVEGSKVSAFDPILLRVQLDGQELFMELDSGSVYTIVSRRTFRKVFQGKVLEKVTDVILTSFTADECKIEGSFMADVQYEGKCRRMRILVVVNGVCDLLGRDFVAEFGLKISMVNNVRKVESVDDLRGLADRLIDEFPDVVTSKMGECTAVPVTLETTEDLKPRFLKAREIPFAYKEEVEKMIQEMVDNGIWEKVEYCEYGTPLVTAPKPNGGLRICGDYKSTINRFLKDFNHPTPTVENILATLSGMKYFFVIDIRDAYLQLRLSDESAQLCAVSTHKGVFKTKRMPFGIKPGSAVFQCTIEKFLVGIEGTAAYIDDVIGGGRTIQEMLERARRVFLALRRAGFTVRRNKIRLFETRVNVLGYIVTAEGFSKDEEKVEKIRNVDTPRNGKEVQAFSGMMNYYAKFVPKLGEIMKPLYKLTEKTNKFTWTPECEEAFRRAKEEMAKDVMLAHYEANEPVILETDASEHTISAVLLQRKNNSERPIAYWSKRMDAAQRNYSVVDKEALAVVKSCQRFSKYLLGRKFTIRTDQKSLLRIFSSEKGLPVTASGRLLRWALFLSGFDYQIQHVASEKNKADPLSRLRQKDSNEPTVRRMGVNAIRENGIPLDFGDVRAETEKDKTLVFVKKCLRKREFELLNSVELVSFYRRREELSVENGLVMWGRRVVVPSQLRKYVLAELHSGHMGSAKMKSRARQYFWWPLMDDDIVKLSNSCEECRVARPSPGKSPLTPWPETDAPWQRLHADYFGPIFGAYFFVLVDSKSKWLEVFRAEGPTASFTIQCLRQCFARFGVPKSLVSDNGTCFTAGEFRQFLRANGVYQSLIAPGHPATNGLAENAVKTVKKALIKVLGKGPKSKEQVDKALQNVLMEYRNTPHCTTEISPAKMLLGREIRDALQQLLPEEVRKELKTESKASKNVKRQVQNHKGDRVITFRVGQKVWVRDYKDPNKPSWVEAEVVRQLGDYSYSCRLPSGRVIKRHVEQIQSPVIEKQEEGKEKDSKSKVKFHEVQGQPPRKYVAPRSRGKEEKKSIMEGEEKNAVETGEEGESADVVETTGDSSTYFDCEEIREIENEQMEDDPPAVPPQEIPLAVRRERRDIRPPRRLIED